MGDADHLEVFPTRSLAAKRLDYIYAALLVIPLVLMAFQGDLVFSFAERFNYQGMYTEVHEAETALQTVKADMKALEQQKAALDPDLAVQRTKLNELTAQLNVLGVREKDLERAVKALRKPLDDQAAYWNLSFVRRWPLALLLGPPFGLLLWFSVPTDERRTLYREALSGTARMWGLIIGFGALAMFWFGAWQQNALDRAVVLNQGTIGYTPSFIAANAYILTYLSLAAWSVGATLLFVGWRGLRRLWLPLAGIMVLLILGYSAMSTRWAHIWDTDERWGYGYFVGPIAAMLLYYKLSENPRVASLQPQLFLGDPPWVRRGEVVTAGTGPVGRDAPAFGHGRAWQRLIVGGIILFLGTAAAWGVAVRLGVAASILRFAYVPSVTGGTLIVLGIWQRVDRNRHAALATRAAGLIVLAVTVFFHWYAVASPVHYFTHLSLVAVLLGGLLAVFGFVVFHKGAWQRLLLGATILFMGIAAARAAAEPLGIEAAILKFANVPSVIGAALVALGVWQLVDRNRHAALAMRATGLIVLVMAVVFRWQAVEGNIFYFAQISIVGVLLGGVLAVFGFRVFRVAWVALAFMVLAIPWPERVYVELASIPQAWAAMMAERFMGLVGYTVAREGNVIQVLPGFEGRLAVAEKCSGLRMLFAFIALSVVYAYISPRRPWRRAVAFASSIPIAVVANFARVFAMALFTRWGYRGVTEGLQHVMAGFIIMLPLAFSLLWLEMKVLDLIEWMADALTSEGRSAGESA